MIYLDANIFLHAILNDKAKGQSARKLLEDISAGRIEASTSCLTWDEVLWKAQKVFDPNQALEASNALLSIPNLRFVPVDKQTIAGTSKMVQGYGLHPRDAIHASAALLLKAQMLSEDRDFDKVKELRRKGL